MRRRLACVARNTNRRGVELFIHRAQGNQSVIGEDFLKHLLRAERINKGQDIVAA